MNWRSGGSWRAAREERVWVAEGFGLGAADASIVVRNCLKQDLQDL